MTQEHVKMICEDAGIGYSGIKINIESDPDLIDRELFGYTSPNGKEVTLYPDVFTNMESLVKTLGHERIHVMKTQLYGKSIDSIMSSAFENGAIQSEASWWDYYKLINGGH